MEQLHHFFPTKNLQLTTKVTNDNIYNVVRSEIERLGVEADLNHLDVSEVTDMDQLFSRTHFAV